MRYHGIQIVLLLFSVAVSQSISSATTVLTTPDDESAPASDSFTLEFWIQAITSCSPGNSAARPNYGAIILDRNTVQGSGFNDMAISVQQTGERTVAFSVSTAAGVTSLGTANFTSPDWQRVAVTRSARGEFGVFINGLSESSRVLAPSGLAPTPLGQRGLAALTQMDSLRMSNSVVYTAGFSPLAGGTAFDTVKRIEPPAPIQALNRNHRSVVFAYDLTKYTYDPVFPGGLQAVPEPGSFLLLGAGCWLLLGRRKNAAGV